MHFLRRRRQADQVETEPAQQAGLVRFRRRLDAPFFELRADEHVDRICASFGDRRPA